MNNKTKENIMKIPQKLYQFTDKNTQCQINHCVNKSYLKDYRIDKTDNIKKSYKHIYCSSHMKIFQKTYGIKKKTQTFLEDLFFDHFKKTTI